MTPIELKVSRIGNSRGVRIPAATLARYRIESAVAMEERSDGIFLRPLRSGPAKLSWAETAQAMAAAGEDWTDWDAATADGLETVPWGAPVARVAERPAEKGQRGKRR
jgi:antitoxin component of MazEF toxin-antitoxin module